MKQFIITGCGRSGTQYMATLLGLLGCTCGEESFYNLRNLKTDDTLTTFLKAKEIVYPERIPVFQNWGNHHG